MTRNQGESCGLHMFLKLELLNDLQLNSHDVHKHKLKFAFDVGINFFNHPFNENETGLIL